MSWLATLNQTYENHAHVIGQFEKKANDREYALIPVSHTTQSAHIEVILDGQGNFITAKVIDKSEASTIIPCTEASASRTSAPVPHPLFDKLIYVAGDYTRYCGEGKGTPHADYMEQLLSWCESPAAHPKVKSVYTYLSKGTLMADLIREKVLWVDEQEKLIEKWTPTLEEKYGERPEIFKVIASDQSAAFVRFAVQIPGEAESRLWRDPSVQQSFVQFYDRLLSERDLCYVTGEHLPYADKHASRIRNSADKSKLISANDTSGFTFRGRFRNSRDAVSISYEVSQKAHNALKWLIDRQGFIVDGKVFLVWGPDRLEVPDPFGDTFSLYQDEEEASGDLAHKEYANQIRRAIGGYRFDGDYKAKVIIMVLDAATPGRMSIVYYRDLNKELFLDRLQQWHETCLWLHRYRKDGENRTISFLGAPSSRDIAFAAYGPRASDKIVKVLIERMLPSIIDGAKIPLDIVRSAVNRASNPVGMEEWEWEKTLSITCALVNKTYEKEGFTVGLDTANKDRSYLFGRMLAIADVLERRALGRDEKRATNAIRYMNAFAQRPGRTWTIIQSNLQPYQARMGTDAGYYNRLLDEVGSQLKAEHFTDRPLSGLYLLGFYSQRHELYKSKKEKDSEAEQINENYEMGEDVQ
ncbi:type I-C CRISPR-associated protein Cas8c/Csd1 [Brevibacillus composti]|uniref:Type I-C CRISPR-associated protein Cas8c/Csd1 n=1 Tax=Brevibacillus composti TaxID=2796470 RepID=A0A7T5ENN4_9BACL|nr:type I-C CRISPR-associated protein Cas8c/Csd1 [Brevibacillus composti]QQE75939.1 type I-C CRISPR-associated protein Cas8c/Csd1 [Brevibacillus composti]QUO42965.1 type I-C CRISPR-associated protein Cas8c/Csd1 [Brevibacillus composti]